MIGKMFRTGFSTLLTILLLLFGAFHASTADETLDGLVISIPSIQVEAPVVPVYIRTFPDGEVTWDVSDLRMAVGHFEGLPFVGQGGNAVLGGHSERARGEADVFYNLHRVQVGDLIEVRTEDVEYQYEVRRVFSVDPRDLSVLYPTPSEQLTLITCDLASYHEASGAYGRRVVVVADRVE